MCKGRKMANYYKSIDYEKPHTIPYGKILIEVWKEVTNRPRTGCASSPYWLNGTLLPNRWARFKQCRPEIREQSGGQQGRWWRVP
jgi:hypothetical protein